VNLTIPLILSKALELGSTEYALSHGAREINPLLQNRSARIAINTSYGSVSALTYKELHKRKPILANVVAGIVIVGNSYLVLRNVRNSR
jgi:hypothetical protein